jgi:hypothetical protein
LQPSDELCGPESAHSVHPFREILMIEHSS